MNTFRCTNNANHVYLKQTLDGFCTHQECYGIGFLISQEIESVTDQKNVKSDRHSLVLIGNLLVWIVIITLSVILIETIKNKAR